MSPAPVFGSVTVHAAQPIVGSSFCQFQLQLTSAVANVPGISRITPWRAWATLPLQTIADFSALAGIVIAGPASDRVAVLAAAVAGIAAPASPRQAMRQANRFVMGGIPSC